MAPTNVTTTLPVDSSTWSAKVQQHELQNMTIHTAQQDNSGSQITKEQYLLLHVIWPEMTRLLDDVAERRRWIEDRHVGSAEAFLNQHSDWKGYLQLLAVGDDNSITLGSFESSWKHQRTAGRLPDAKPSPRLTFTRVAMRAESETVNQPVYDIFAPYTGDRDEDNKTMNHERIVYYGLDPFFLALACRSVDMHMMFLRGFVVKDRNENTMYKARVDGILCRRSDQQKEPKVLAIANALPCARRTDIDSIRMLEGAQMAAWISQHPPSESQLEKARKNPGHRFRRTLISQDRNEFYIVFTDFDADYVDYIRDTVKPSGRDPGQPPSLLRMYEYGPFNTNSANDMKAFGQLALALCYQLADVGLGEHDDGNAA